jgi:hypothetical protein
MSRYPSTCHRPGAGKVDRMVMHLGSRDVTGRIYYSACERSHVETKSTFVILAYLDVPIASILCLYWSPQSRRQETLHRELRIPIISKQKPEGLCKS